MRPEALFEAFAELSQPDRLAFCALLHERVNTFCSLSAMTRGEYRIISLKGDDAIARKGQQLLNIRERVLGAYIPAVEELVGIKSKRRVVKKKTREWFPEIHKLRKRFKWDVVFDKLKGEKGFPFTTQKSMEQRYGRVKQKNPELFPD